MNGTDSHCRKSVVNGPGDLICGHVVGVGWDHLDEACGSFPLEAVFYTSQTIVAVVQFLDCWCRQTEDNKALVSILIFLERL